MKIMEEPKVECIMFTNSVDLSATCSNVFTCSGQYCDLQGCPEDDCGGFNW